MDVAEITGASEAVADALADDAKFSGRLSLYDGTAAIFAHGLVPPSAGLPFCVVDDPTIDKPMDTKTTRGRDVMLTVRVYFGPGLGADAESVAEVARSVLHRSPVDVAPYLAWMTDVEGPMPVAAPGRIGRQIRVRISLST